MVLQHKVIAISNRERGLSMKDLKKLQQVELSLLEKFKEICKKFQLTYYAACGTLLGTIRHKGFIPWDDDMDLFLPWPDYKKLVEVAPKECAYPFFFQSIYTEPDAMANACRLRRSDTTGFTKWEYENVGPGYDLGIFIDIFPLFYVPDSENDREKQKKAVMHAWRCIHGYDALNQQKRGGYVNEQYAEYIP
jgi:lipopolysaccharide cholinephosphotransferase